jgi:hypothetical protein
MKIYKQVNGSGHVLAMQSVEDSTILPPPWVELTTEEALPILASLALSAPSQPPVPESVTPRQIRLALTCVGLRATVEAAIAQAPQDVRDDWEYALEMRRDWPALNALAQQLGITPEQIEDLFTLAATL